VPIDRLPWSVVKREGNDRVAWRRAVAWWIHGPTWRPSADSCHAIGPRPAPDSTTDSLFAILGDSRPGYEGRPRSLRAAAFAYLHSSSASRSLFHLSSA
jgi:hypothetical protein